MLKHYRVPDHNPVERSDTAMAIADAISRLAYKFRLYPTSAQAAFLDDQVREACGLYNAGGS